MELKQIFRLIIAAHWALIVLAFAVFALSENLDKEYEEVLLDINQRDIISMIVVVVSSIIGYIGLFMLQRWAKHVYLLAALLAVTWTSGQGNPYINIALVEAILDLLLITTGLTIGLAYFSPIKDELV